MEEDNDQNETFSKLPDTLDAEYFSISFHPADYSILDALNQIILPGVRTHLENQLGFDKFSAGLCRLDVSSSQSDSASSNYFVEKIDAPDIPYQIGHLVVCLPSPFKGGNMLVQSHDKKTWLNLIGVVVVAQIFNGLLSILTAIIKLKVLPSSIESLLSTDSILRDPLEVQL